MPAANDAPTGRSYAASTMVGRTKVNWDDSKMRSTYANVCNVATTREEVMLLFGTSQNWTNASEEISVELLERVIMNPFAAKRLLLLLAKTIEEYEKQHGSLSSAELSSTHRPK
jgi:uncharacterized protein DUF3467